ncbi:hypothetical protein [Limnoglobus roseus]|uniref:Uncharacterized protein n=1 Tax=Limnoglobus roseus TaxID=2598579 RepID=A0A5C1A2S3_9BACT|nr:hypothetical protein [Limnoglobus roseus]QEL13431.1 hypothetical protein PX52LOC_00288 [Limnoglobus roseus]
MRKCLFGLMAVLAVASATRADHVDKLMVEQADKIFAAVKGLGAKNVAVLKFDYRHGATGKPSFTAGSINGLMANRLEHLLVLKNDDQDPVRILADAGPAIANISKKTKSTLSWRTEAGRKEISTITGLPLAWDAKTKLNPDGFVTGEVTLSEDYATTTVKFFGFTKANPTKLVSLYTLDSKSPGSTVASARGVQANSGKIKTDRATLTHAGVSFGLNMKARSKGMDADDTEAAANAAAKDNAAPTAPAPGGPPIIGPAATPPKSGPVQLQVFFDDAEQPYEANGGEPRIQVSPKQGQKVKFKLTNTSATDTYPVILAINGINTNAIDNDSLMDKAPVDQRKWVLGPNESTMIEGFYTTKDGAYKPFEVLPEDESARRYDQMNATYRGKISLLVFGKRLDAAPPVSTDKPGSADAAFETIDDNATANATDLGAAPKGYHNAGSPAKARGMLEKTTHVDASKPKLAVSKGVKAKFAANKKGLIDSSGETRQGGEIQQVKVEYDPQPVANLDITYYTLTGSGN